MWTTNTIGFSFSEAHPSNRIASWFEINTDFRYYFSAPNLAGAVPTEELAVSADEILLTPGMCAVIRYGLRCVSPLSAEKVMEKAGEDDDSPGTRVLAKLIHQFGA
jgi:hypothetical protein